MILTKEAKEFIFDMVPECIKVNNSLFWGIHLSSSERWPVTCDDNFLIILKDCWNSLAMGDKEKIFDFISVKSFDILESIFNSPNDENDFLDAILGFKGFKGKVWEDGPV